MTYLYALARIRGIRSVPLLPMHRSISRALPAVSLSLAAVSCGGSTGHGVQQGQVRHATTRLAASVPRRPPRRPAPPTSVTAGGGPLLRGQGHAGDWTTNAAGVRHLIRLSDLPAPYASPSYDNMPHLYPRPSGLLPKAPPGFHVELFATGIRNPRAIFTAPDGDLFVADSEPGRLLVFRPGSNPGRPSYSGTFASHLDKPFGLAFYPPGPNPRYLYVGNTGAVVRFPYRNGDLHARTRAEMVVPNIPSGGHLRGGGHWTRYIVFSPDGRKMYVSVGSLTNDGEHGVGPERHRADILQFNPDGSGGRVWAYGIRNAVGLAVQPGTGEIWASVNERDGLGNDLVPDYITHVQPGGFYGWPWFYMGPHWDPRHRGAHLELRNRVITPDVMVQSHSASLQMTFYTGSQFPAGYQGTAFAAFHGSWNRRPRTGFKVIRVLFNGSRPTGEYEDFLTGFTLSNGEVWGRPVGVAVGRDGSLFVSDDGSGSIWRVSYGGR